MEYKKLNDTTAEITTPQPSRVDKVSLDMLFREKEMYEKQIVSLTAKLQVVETKITEVKKLGIKTIAEMK